jgi:hypothetical protein
MEIMVATNGKLPATQPVATQPAVTQPATRPAATAPTASLELVK